MAIEQKSALEAVRTREHVLARSYFPQFNLQFAFYSRGSGSDTRGQLDGSEGLLPETANWAAGLTVNFQVLEIFNIHARRQAEASNETAEMARYEQTLQALKAQEAKAQALIDAAQRIAENTPIQLKAAQETEARSRVRYEAGLATVIEVAEAQRLLVQAEIDNAVARLGVWHALLAVARVRGDIKPFLEQATNSQIQRR